MLSLLTVAKLCPEDAHVRIVDEQIEDMPLQEDFDVVGITCMTSTAPRTFELCRHFQNRQIPVVLGGFFPSLNPQLALNHCDAVIIGPAFNAWPKLLEDLKNNKMQKIYRGNPNSRIPEKLPRHLMKKNQYSIANATYATMGCTNTCKFCSISAVFNAQHHCRPIQEVIEEIRSFKTRFFMFVDDNLTQNREYVFELFKQMIPLKKKWITQASIDLANDPKLLRLLQKAGCIGVFVGLETFNEKNLAGSDKEFNHPQEYKKAIETIHQHGIFVEAGIILGFDEDDVTVFESTLDLLNEIKIDAVQVSILTPLPGTELHRQMQNRIIDTDFEHYDYRHVTFQPKQMSAEQLQAGADWVIRKFYSPVFILRRMLQWIKTPGGIANLHYLLALNAAYFGRVKVFGIGGYNPALQKEKEHLFGRRTALPNNCRQCP